jgi:sugar/nucleoside kinase (ribokinase family)
MPWYYAFMKMKRLQDISDTFDLKLPSNKPFDVVGFGLNSVDHLCIVPEYPRLDSKSEIVQYEQLPGGQVATAMIFLSRMGLSTKYIGKVGDDNLGRFCLQKLELEAIDISSIRIEKGARNQFSIIIVDRQSGERTVLCKRDSRLDFTEQELSEEAICAGKILHLDGNDPASLRAATWCQKHEIPVCIDLDQVTPNCKELIEQIDFLIVSSGFSSDYTGISDPIESFHALRRKFNGFLAMTMGCDGAMAWVGDRCIQFPKLLVKAIDTTGAGDIFHGAFIYGLLQNWPLNKIMGFANAAAGLSCTHVGAQQGIRSLSEILRHMERME